MRKIYVVSGTTGAYDDKQEWFLKAFTSKARAEQLAEDASHSAKIIHRHLQGRSYMSWDQNAPKNEYDPEMRMDYTGTDYMVFELDLDEGVFLNAAREAASEE